MKKNTASQVIGAQLVSATDGAAFTGAVTVAVTGDGGTQATGSVGSGACTHEGNGFHSYAPSQAETNYSHVAFTFTGTGAIPVTIQVYTTFPQSIDNATGIAAIKAVTDVLPDSGALTSLATASALSTAQGNITDILTDTGTTIPATLATLATASVLGTPAGASVAADIIALSSGYVAPDNASIAAILEDTGTTIPAQITALNDTSASDVVTALKADMASDAGPYAVNVKEINDAAVTGAGTEGDPWS